MSALKKPVTDVTAFAPTKREQPIFVRLKGVPDLVERPLDKLSIDEMAQEINREARVVGAIGRVAMGAAWRRILYMGRLYNELKLQLPHGSWIEWFENNIKDVSIRVAQNHMLLAWADEEGLLPAENEPDSYLTYTETLKAIRSMKAKLKSNDSGDSKQNKDRSDEDVEFNAMCDNYEKASASDRERFHEWLNKRYGVEVNLRSLSEE